MDPKPNQRGFKVSHVIVKDLPLDVLGVTPKVGRMVDLVLEKLRNISL